jgi:competence protein ComFC
MSSPGFKRSPVYRLYQLAWAALDWVYPPTCGGCTKRGIRWCTECQSSVRKLSAPLCPLCGESQRFDGLCLQCRTQPHVYTALRSWARFEGSLRNAIHRLKYKGELRLGEALAKPLIEYFRELNWQVELVVPVPLGVARQAQRGYNQAALIARPVALSEGLTYQPAAIRKIKFTRTQVGLSRAERLINVAQAFQAESRIVAQKRILLIDDVTTSGATIDACARAMLEADAAEVYGLTLARAPLRSETSTTQITSHNPSGARTVQ